MAVGLTHSKGVAGVMAGADNEVYLKGLAAKRRGMRKRYAEHREGIHDANEISPHIETGSRGAGVSVHELGSFAERRVSQRLLL